jgi:SNF2 family DNA or RNA helicase
LVVPASLIGNWRAEVGRFAPGLSVFVAHASVTPREALARFERTVAEVASRWDIILTTYTRLTASDSLRKHTWGLAVLDEAQAIKNATSRQSLAAREIRARWRIALTGTPIENRASDLWTLFDFLNPGLLGSAAAFAEHERRLAQPGGPGWGPVRELVAPFLLRRLKTDRSLLPDLPDKIEITERCRLTRRQAILYARIIEELKTTLERPDLPPLERQGLALGFLMQCKQVCNHPSHWAGDGGYDPTQSGKFLRLGEIATELAARGERLLIFTQFAEMCGPLAAFLAPFFGRAGSVLHGGTPVAERQRLVAAFQRPEGPPFFILSVKAGGTGLTLTAAQHVVHFDRWWNPAVEAQATDRAHRMGQKRTVIVHTFVCPGTIESKIDKLMGEKRALSDDLFAGMNHGGTRSLESALARLPTDQLLAALQLDED